MKKMDSMSNYLIENNDLRIKILELTDAYKIVNWSRHNNELFIDYDLGKFTKKQLENQK